MVTKFAGMPKLPEIERIAQTYGLPDGVTVSGDAGECVRFASNDRRYPIETKLATYVSGVRFWEDAVARDDIDRDVLAEINKAAAFHQLTEDLRSKVLTKISAELNAPTADDYPDSDFALVVKRAEGKLRVYPIFDSAHVKASAEEFAKNRARLPYAMRKQAAQKLLAKMSGVSVGDDVLLALNRSAGRGVATRDKLASAVRSRYHLLVGQPAMQAEANNLTKVASLLDTAKVTRAGCENLASLLAGIDEATSIHTKYAYGVNLPEDLCHELTQAEFERDLASVFTLSTGTAYHRDDAVKIGQALVGLMPDVKAEVCGLRGEVRAEKFASWAESQTDRNIARTIELIASNVGAAVSPYSHLL